jgi:hypothetical protein
MSSLPRSEQFALEENSVPCLERVGGHVSIVDKEMQYQNRGQLELKKVSSIKNQNVRLILAQDERKCNKGKRRGKYFSQGYTDVDIKRDVSLCK